MCLFIYLFFLLFWYYGAIHLWAFCRTSHNLTVQQVEAKFEAYKNDELVEKKTVRLYAEDRVVCGRDSKKKVGWQVLHTSVSRRHAKITAFIRMVDLWRLRIWVQRTVHS